MPHALGRFDGAAFGYPAQLGMMAACVDGYMCRTGEAPHTPSSPRKGAWRVERRFRRFLAHHSFFGELLGVGIYSRERFGFGIGAAFDALEGLAGSCGR